ncbi:MAG: hypothetical protein JWM76_382 [Pseudonocardiales bacterium]|nr:hypothetical protein [Pseudonocardiales bacterium]
MSSESVPDLGVLAAVVNRQSADLSVYAEFLVNSLAGALPPEQVVVKRKRSLLGRTDDDAPVLSVALTVGEHTYLLARPKPAAVAVASIAHTVGGIVLSTRTVPLGEWSERVAAALTALSESNADAAALLSRITRFTV